VEAAPKVCSVRCSGFGPGWDCLGKGVSGPTTSGAAIMRGSQPVRRSSSGIGHRQVALGPEPGAFDGLGEDVQIGAGLAWIVWPGLGDGGGPAGPLKDEQVEVGDEPAGELKFGQPFREGALPLEVALARGR